MRQLPLSLRWPAQQRFDTYVPGANSGSLALLRNAADSAQSPWIFLSGASGSGKTHLLIATCAEAGAHGVAAQYLPLRKMLTQRADAIRTFAGRALLCVDDVDAIAGQREAEHALFDLYNRCRAEQATLLFAASAPPAQLGLGLPDLVSRLASCIQAPLKPLSDSERRHALQQRALARGLTLEPVVLDYLFSRHARDLGSLTALLDRLDRESLAAQRRITVPFLRQMLEREP